MKILFVDWGGYGAMDMKEAFIEEGHELLLFPYTVSASYPYGRYVNDEETEARLQAALREKVPEAVFSINYFPVISKVCQKEGIRYISWNYDCPHRLLYSPTIRNACNSVYVFDKKTCLEFHDEGIANMYYMPLAVATDRLDAIGDRGLASLPFLYDISFVGSLYLEKVEDTFGMIEGLLPDYAKGYLKALCAVQLKVQGCDLIEPMLGPVLEDMHRVYPVSSAPFFTESREHIFGDIIKHRLTAIERIDLLETIAREYKVDLFTHIIDFPIEKVCDHGTVDYYTEMPMVFKQSKINLNITLRNIKSGIPLRAFDIMGSGGFLLTNFQADFLEHFLPGEDFVYYEDREDLLQKIDYYLIHEEEREEIAKNGHDKVAAEHTYRHRVKEMTGAV